MPFAPKAKPSTLADAAGNTGQAIPDYASRRYAEITKNAKKQLLNITTETLKDNVVITSASNLDGGAPDTTAVGWTPAAGNNYNDIITEASAVLHASEFMDLTSVGAEIREAAEREAKAAAKRQATIKAGSDWTTMLEISSENVTITANADKTITDNFQPKPQPPEQTVRGKDRRPWAEIQEEFKNHILPNELYDDGENEYELTAYQLTWFLLSEGDCEGPLNEVAARYQEPGAVKNSVIIAQTSGSDEFYIEELEFESILGGPGIIATSFNFSIRSPYQADLVDHIFKASQLLGIRNHNDIPMFLLINWNARNTETGEGKTLTTSRCIPFRIINIALTYDDGGGMYEVNAARYQEHNLNTTYGSLQKDVSLQGVYVKDMVSELLSQARSVFANTIDAVVLPDVYSVIMSKEMADYELVTDDQRKLSDQTQNSQGDLAIQKSVADPPPGTMLPIERAVTSANSSAVLTETSTRIYNKYSMYKVATYTKGKSITSILRDILESTKLYQQKLTALEVDVNADTAQMERSDPKEIKRYIIGFDTETEILGYDTFRRVYACKRTYICRMRLDPSLAKDEPSTNQDPATSYARLMGMLDNGLIKKAYPFYWSGLNTEIKGLDFKFDNHWINAQTLYSKMGGTAKRTTGINADKILAEGSTGVAWQKVRDPFMKGIHDAEAAISKQDTIMEDASQENAIFQAAMIKSATRKKKRAEDLLKKLEQQLGDKAAIALAIQENKLTVVTESRATNDPGYVIVETGHSYFKENLEKFTGGIVYVGDLKADDAKGILFPIPQIGSSIPKISSGMREDYDRGYNILSEIMAKHEGGDMIEIDLEIRGDPYWIPKYYHLTNEDSVSPVFQQPYLIILASSINDYNNAGIFQVNERSSLNALYRIITVQNRFSGGEFVQSLKCYRDMTVEINSLIREPDAFVQVDDFAEFGNGMLQVIK